MKAAVLMACALLLSVVGLGALTTRYDRVDAQEVKIEPGRKPTPKPATPTPTPRKPVVNRTPRRAATDIEMVLVPEGSFLMGSPENEPRRSANQGPQRRVTVRSFYIGKYEVTQAQWRAVMGDNPSRFKGNNLPVENVSWNDAKKFCLRLSQMAGEDYRLPTEAEWEYSCRAKTDDAYSDNPGAVAWYGNNSGLNVIDALALYREVGSNFDKYRERLSKNGNKTHLVGQKIKNAFRLYDMIGNVEEWCEDDWHISYANAPSDGIAWVNKPIRGSNRVRRGCGWDDFTFSCQSTYRYFGDPSHRFDNVGFRLARTYR